MNRIHPTAVVDPKAELGESVEIGPHCYVGPGVVLGDGCRLMHNVTIIGNTQIGSENVFFPGAVIGAEPQDLKYKGTATQLIIGKGNVFREHVTVHTGTEVAGGVTRIGDHNRFLVGVHVAHDAQIGSHCVIANNVQIAGHCCIEDRVHLGGLVGMHHFVTIGRCAYIAGMARLTIDAPPFMVMHGYPAQVRGVNVQGLQRWGFSEEEIQQLRNAYKVLFSRKAGDPATLAKRIAALESNGELDGNVRYLVEFVKRSLQRGIYGRYRESLRRDTAEDRQAFYSEARDFEPTEQDDPEVDG